MRSLQFVKADSVGETYPYVEVSFGGQQDAFLEILVDKDLQIQFRIFAKKQTELSEAELMAIFDAGHQLAQTVARDRDFYL